MDELKECIICKTKRHRSLFNKHNHSKDGLDGRCRECYLEYRRQNYLKTRDLRKKYKENRNKKFPWIASYFSIKDRCENQKSMHYDRYGKRGIKCLITPQDLKKLWFRDKAYMMKRPTVDRIDNDGHYEYTNCQYLECSENARKSNKSIKAYEEAMPAQREVRYPENRKEK